ncbi:hypothetical protein [Acidovorax sp.]|uniref:hypothetical protein n=1 Tax=Acidovorax sp. TaxID=1872122 RepID=UPI0031D127C1
MKKPSIELWIRQWRLAKYRSKAHRRSKKRHYIKPASKYVAPGEVIRAPSVFRLAGYYGVSVSKFLKAVARSVLDLKIATKLDFRNTTIFHQEAAILLFADLDRIANLAVIEKPLTIINPIARRPREVLKQVGMHDITGDVCNVIPSRQDVVYWKSTKGLDQSGSNLAVLEVVAEKVNKEHADQLVLDKLWRGVSEAVANSVDHAYKFPRFDGFQGLKDTRWWMFTQLRDGVFNVAVCDLGCGYGATIGHTIPEKFVSEFRSILFDENKDVFSISTALAYGRSGTKQSERGKGSRDAFSVIEGHGEGTLLIMSNRGYVEHTFSSGKVTKKVTGGLEISIGGTIVMWKLPLKEQ